MKISELKENTKYYAPRIWIVFTLVIFAWCGIYAFLPKIKDDAVVESVKQIMNADKQIDMYLEGIARNAETIDSAYTVIQANGESRFYSKHDIRIGSGAYLITKHSYEKSE